MFSLHFSNKSVVGTCANTYHTNVDKNTRNTRVNNLVCRSGSKSDKLRTIISDIEKRLPTIKQKLHNCIVMNKMEDRHRIMLISDVNSEIGDIQTILNKLKVEIDQCNYFCSHSHIKI